MKKILLIADSNMSLSGVPVVYMSIVRQLHSEYTFDIIVLKDNDMYFEKEFLSFGGKIFKYKFNKPDDLLKKLFWISAEYYKDVKNFISNNINLSEYEAIHSFQEGFSYPFIKEAKKAGVKHRILQICSAKSAYPEKRTISQISYNSYQKKAMKYCTSIAFVSQKSLEMKDYKNKGIVLYNIYDEKTFGEIAECNHNNLVLTQIATFSQRKNQMFSLEVIKKIKVFYPDVILNIVGSELEKGYLQKMNEYIESNGLQDNIKFLGNKVNRIELNKDTSFILYPSTMESFGLVLIEAQACGIHCFANSAIPNDADMGNTDFIPLDPELWTSKIVNYFKDNGNKRKKPINEDKFSTSQFIKTLKRIYED